LKNCCQKSRLGKSGGTGEKSPHEGLCVNEQAMKCGGKEGGVLIKGQRPVGHPGRGTSKVEKTIKEENLHGIRGLDGRQGGQE